MTVLAVLQRVGGVLGRAAQTVVRVVWRLFPASHYALLALLFVVGLELIFALQRWVIVIALTVVGVVTVGVVVLRFEERETFRPMHTILPILATIGLSGFTFFVPTTPLLHVYIVAAGIILFLLLKHGAREAYPLWNWSLSLVVYFLNIAFLLGLRFHRYLPLLGLLSLVLLVTALMSLQALRRVASSWAEVVLPGLGLTFVLTQVLWILQFLPVHYLVQAGIVTTFYYVIFNLISLSYSRTPSRRDVLEYVGIGLTALAIITFSARWQ